ncbi:hypothetical protein K7W42_20255 [Deinococcus sp. HMF7604]|uniref:hypothetical protein n=1 Tax=Deinococcus betulae TaxID=2873312 RepID=UPI001CCCC3C8|nr:hypothetical protein [Deinococcus betulae]MBZ9753172.1 hypothetical protein [Deinococcus betulae]
MTKADAAAARVKAELGRAIGEIVLPGYVKLVRSGTQVSETLRDMVLAYGRGGKEAEAFAAKHPQVVRALDALRPAAEAMQRAVQTAWAGIQMHVRQTLLPSIQSVMPVVERVWTYVPGIIDRAGQLIGETFRLVHDLWERVLKPAWEAIAPVVSAALASVGRLLQGALDLVRGIFQAVRALMDGDWQAAWNLAKEAVGKALLAIQDVLDQLLPAVWEMLKNLAVGAFERAKTIGANLKDGIIAGAAGLAADLATWIDDAIQQMTDRIPAWARGPLGIDASNAASRGVTANIRATGDAAQARVDARNTASTNASIAAAGGQLEAGSLSLAVWQQAFMARNDQKADTIVDYCMRWVRDTLGDANPKMRAEIDKLFQANPERYTDQNGKVGYVPTARSAARNLEAADLMRNYSSTADLKPGDTVFYTDGGQNHVGTYIGAGQVRGNNRVSFGATGNPVGNVGINQLGHVSGYVSTAELEAYLKARGGGSVLTPTPAASSAGAAGTLALPGQVPLAGAGGIAKPDAKTLKEYNLTLADWNKYQARALELAREAAKAEKDLTGDRGLEVAAIMRKWAGEDKGRQQSFQLATSLVAKQQQAEEAAAAKAKQLATEGLQAAEQATAEQLRLAEEVQRRLQEQAQARREADQQIQALTSQQLQQRVQAEEEAAGKLEKQRQTRLEGVQGDLQLTLAVERNYQRRSLAQATETAGAQLALAKRSAEQAYSAAVAAIPEGATAAQVKAIKDGAAEVQKGAVSGAYRAYYNAVGQAAETGAERVKTATQAITDALTAGAEAGEQALAQLGNLNLGGIDGRGAASAQPEQIPLATIIEQLPRLSSEVPGFTRALRELAAEGKISAGVLDTALLLIPKFSEGLGQVGDAFAEVEARLDAQSKRLDDLNGQYDRGELTLDAYRDGLTTLVGSYDLQAQAAERANQPALVTFFRAAEQAARNAAKGIRTLNDELAEIAQRGKDALWLAQNAGETGPITQRVAENPDGTATFGDTSGFDQAMSDAFSGDTADQIAQAIALSTSEAFQDAGQESREQFWRRFADLQTAPDFGAAVQSFSAQTLYGLTRAMGDNEGWATLKATFQTRFTELLARTDLTEAAPLETLLEGITGATDRATQQFQTGQLDAEGYAQALNEQANALTALLPRLDAMGPEGAEAATSVRALLSATLGLVPATQNLVPALDAAEELLLRTTAGNIELEQALTSGTMSQQEFAQAVLETLPRLEALARAADAAKRPEIAAAYRAQAAELRSLGGGTLKVAEGLQKFGEYGQYATDLAGRLANLAEASGNGNLAANISGAVKAFELVKGVAMDIAQGNWVGAAVKVLGSLIDAFAGFARAKAEAAKAREDFQKQFSLINADAFSSFTTRSRGFFADVFGGGPEVLRQVNETAASIAKAIESGVLGGFQNGIKAFLSGTGDLLTGIREGVRGALIDAVTQALIQGAILKGTLGKLLTDLTTTLASGGDVTGIIGQIGAALPAIAKTLEGVLKPIKSAIDKALPPTPATGGSGSSGGPAYSTGPVQAGVPTAVIDILNTARDLLKGANEAPRLMMDAARLSYRAAELQYAAAERFAGPHNSGTLGSR